MSVRYDNALIRIRHATAVWKAAQADYRNRVISDAAYFKARRAYAAAEIDFDEAFALEEKNSEREAATSAAIEARWAAKLEAEGLPYGTY